MKHDDPDWRQCSTTLPPGGPQGQTPEGKQAEMNWRAYRDKQRARYKEMYGGSSGASQSNAPSNSRA